MIGLDDEKMAPRAPGSSLTHLPKALEGSDQPEGSEAFSSHLADDYRLPERLSQRYVKGIIGHSPPVHGHPVSINH